MRKRDAVLLALGGLWLVPAAHSQERERAPDDAPPDLARPDIEFLEYLGSWQGDDDEWWAIAEWDKDNAADRNKDAPKDGSRDDGDGDKGEDRGEPEPPQPRK